MNGRKLKQISTCTDQSGQKVFPNINSLAASKDASRFYVADFKKGLIVPDNNRHAVRSFNGEQLLVLRIAVLMKKVGYKSNNGLQFISDGELIEEFMETAKEKKRILTLCCNAKVSKICISSYNDAFIGMYDM
jgi:hypothetical protein